MQTNHLVWKSKKVDWKKSIYNYAYKYRDSKKNYKTTDLKFKWLKKKQNIMVGKSKKKQQYWKIFSNTQRRAGSLLVKDERHFFDGH